MNDRSVAPVVLFKGIFEILLPKDYYKYFFI